MNTRGAAPLLTVALDGWTTEAVDLPLDTSANTENNAQFLATLTKSLDS